MEHQVARRVTIADVAEAAGVSKTAVSFAFNNPGRLAADTATRIIEIADSLGYRPDPVARMLTQRRTGTIGLVVPQAWRRSSRTRSSACSARASRRSPRTPATPSISSRRCTGRCRGRSRGRPSTASSRSASPPTIPRSPRSGGPACR